MEGVRNGGEKTQGSYFMSIYKTKHGLTIEFMSFRQHFDRESNNTFLGMHFLTNVQTPFIDLRECRGHSFYFKVFEKKGIVS